MHTDEQEHREWLASLANLSAARDIVDLGCGRGSDLAILTEQARVDAHLVGVDSSDEKLCAARLAVPSPRVAFLLYDLDSSLPFEAQSVDVAFSNNVLECIADGSRFLRDVHRILRPAGQVVFAHWDWDSQIFDCPDQALARRAVHAWCDWKQPWMRRADGWMGRRLWSTFQGVELFDGQVFARTLVNTDFEVPWFGHARLLELEYLVDQGLLERPDFDFLLASQRELASQKKFFYSITGYVYVGRRAA
jgi:SAM-dependent methyltransferase